jgi:hypothetical protein
MDWQPIETAPKDGTIIDVWTSGGWRVADVAWDESIRTWCCVDERRTPLPELELTHWMPEPPAPAGSPSQIQPCTRPIRPE